MARNAFLTSIEERFRSMGCYEDPLLHKKARNLIPVVLLELRAQERMRLLQKQIKQGDVAEDINVSIQEMLLLELLAWFKEDFFEWVDSPECDFCDLPTKFSHMSTDKSLFKYTNRIELTDAKVLEKSEYYQRVPLALKFNFKEITEGLIKIYSGSTYFEFTILLFNAPAMHRCNDCEQFTPFYRYEDLSILLETREGRCGEWASVFTLLCRVMGWNARLVVDRTDHVWTEVYSIAQNRWLHCDPCENTCDNPLVYESGWGKKLSYIIAYSCDEVQDVTWRYSSDHQNILSSRRECSEEDLIKLLIRLRNYKLQQFSPAKRKFLTNRTILELVELMTEKKPTDADKQGRTSGSLSWRLQRGETKINCAKIWAATDHDLSIGQMTVRYSPNLDQYERVRQGTIVETVSKWQNGVFEAANIVRKEEKDWKIVYLAREETSDTAEVQWKFESGTTGKVIDKVMIQFDTQVFENGVINIEVQGNGKSIDLSNSSSLITEDFTGSQSLTIVASLSGGKGDCAWQHTQLFRQPTNSTDFPFVVSISFK